MNFKGEERRRGREEFRKQRRVNGGKEVWHTGGDQIGN